MHRLFMSVMRVSISCAVRFVVYLGEFRGGTKPADLPHFSLSRVNQDQDHLIMNQGKMTFDMIICAGVRSHPFFS